MTHNSSLSRAAVALPICDSPWAASPYSAGRIRSASFGSLATLFYFWGQSIYRCKISNIHGYIICISTKNCWKKMSDLFFFSVSAKKLNKRARITFGRSKYLNSRKFDAKWKNLPVINYYYNTSNKSISNKSISNKFLLLKIKKSPIKKSTSWP